MNSSRISRIAPGSSSPQPSGRGLARVALADPPMSLTETVRPHPGPYGLSYFSGASLVQRRQDVSDGLVELERHGLHVIAVLFETCKTLGTYAFACQVAQFGGEGT